VAKKIKGKNFVAADEKLDNSIKTYRGSQSGIKEVAERLKTAQKKKLEYKRLAVKPQKKAGKPVSGQKKIQY
jgi:hypothetical protein